MGFEDLEEAVVDAGMCTSCGVCAVACPESAIVFGSGSTPRVRDAWKTWQCGECTDCLQCCPGLDPGTAESEVRLFGSRRSPRDRWLGHHTTTFGGRATDEELFERSASGGSATALLQAAASMLGATTILAMGRRRNHWHAAPVLTHSAERLVDCSQATYQLIPYLDALREHFEERGDDGVVVVGLPCHIQGLRKLQRLDTAVGRWAAKRIVFLIEIACSSNTPPAATESLFDQEYGLNGSQMREVRYREGEYPGAVVAVTGDGNLEVPFWKAVKHFSNKKTVRCLRCPDWLSGLSDLAVSDGDPDIYSASRGVRSISKHGLIYVRTTLGREVIDYACKEGLLDIWEEQPSDFNLGLERKRHRWALAEQDGCTLPTPPLSNYVDQLQPRQDGEFLS